MHAPYEYGDCRHKKPNLVDSKQTSATASENYRVADKHPDTN